MPQEKLSNTLILMYTGASIREALVLLKLIY